MPGSRRNRGSELRTNALTKRCAQPTARSAGPKCAHTRALSHLSEGKERNQRTWPPLPHS